MVEKTMNPGDEAEIIMPDIFNIDSHSYKTRNSFSLERLLKHVDFIRK